MGAPGAVKARGYLAESICFIHLLGLEPWRAQAPRSKFDLHLGLLMSEGVVVKKLVVAAAILLALCAGLAAITTQPACTPAGPRSDVSVDPRQLEADVRRLVEGFGPRDEAHPENLDRAAAWIADELRRTGAAVELQPYRVGAREYRNVIARFGRSDEPIVVGAHYDTCGPLPGADDNASGVAGLLALARLVGEAPPPGAVELVAYTLEEPPHFRTPDMGSAVHAAALARRGVQVRAMLSLEMLGTFSDEPRTQEFPTSLLKLLYPTRGNFIALVGKMGQGGLARRIKRTMRRASPLPVESISAPALIRGIDFSDHLNYWKHGWPALMVTDTAFFRNPRYHTADDTPEKLDYARMAQVVIGVHAAVMELAGAAR